MKTITKLQIISEHLCYGPEPEENDEIEQHLTIRADDRFWLSRYCYGNGYGEYTLSEKTTGKLYAGRALRIIDLIERYCERNEIAPQATDCGSWNMTVFYSDGSKKRFTGSLIPEDDLLCKVSQMIREEMNDYELFAFDGITENTDQYISPIYVFEKYLPLLYENTFLWEQFQILCKELFYIHLDNKDYFAFVRDPAVINTWEQLLENMGGGIPVSFFQAAAFIILAYRNAGHDIDAELKRIPSVH